MDFEVGLENNMEGRTCAWVLDHPGCFAYGTDPPTALAAIPEAIHRTAAGALPASSSTWLEPSDGIWIVSA